MRFWGISRSGVGLAILLFVNGSVALAQKSGPPTAPAGGPGPGHTGPLAPSNVPAPGTSSSQPSINTPSSILLSGRVITDDGSPVDTNTRIERVCGAKIHLEAHVDSRGGFAFQIGGPTTFDVDASTAYSGFTPSNTTASSDSGVMPSRNPDALGQSPLAGCELRATLTGYHSDVIELSGHRSMDNPDVGTIVLHHLGKIEGTTTSMTTLEAPKGAKKAYDKAMQEAQKGKFEDAVNHLNQATSAYPRYAVAWEAMGEIASKQGDVSQAQRAFESAIKADSHYVNPYDQLGLVFAREKKWQEAADTSERAISLDPVEFPDAFWCNAIANYNLKKTTDAERSARALIKLDTQRHYPQAEKMLGELLFARGNLQEGTEHVKTYLSLAPNAPDANEVREWLGKVQQASATPAPAKVPVQ